MAYVLNPLTGQLDEVGTATSTKTVLNAITGRLDYVGLYSKSTKLVVNAVTGALDAVDSGQPLVFVGSMTLTARAGAEIPFPEYKKLDGTYIALPEPIWDTCTFELSVAVSGNTAAVTWRDARHIGTTTVPATGSGTIVGGHLIASITYGAYTIQIDGTIAGVAFSGSIVTLVRDVSESHTALGDTVTPSTLAFVPGVYYSQFGSDLFDGLSLVAPKLTPPTPAQALEGDVYYLERGSIFETGYIGHPYLTIDIIGVGAGHRPVGNSFDVATTWTDAGGGAWSMTFVAPPQPLFADQGMLSRTQVIEDGMPLVQKANLTEVQATAGTYAFSAPFATGATVTVWIHPTADPNTSGKVYEVVTRQGFACAMGACALSDLIGRGGTSRNGVIVHRPSHNAATDVQATIRNCIATHGITHNFACFGGTLRDCGALFCQGQTSTETNAHYVLAVDTSDSYPMIWHLDNCFSINNPAASVFGDAAILVETIGASAVGSVATFDKWHQAYCRSFGGSMSNAIQILRDSIVERLWGTDVLSTGRYSLTRCRVYQVGTWVTTSIRLTDANAAELVASDSVFAGAFINSPGTGTGFIHAVAHATQSRNYSVENCTIVDTGAYVPWLMTINMNASSNVTFRLSGVLTSGFSQAVRVVQDSVNAPTRTAGGDYNTFDAPTATVLYRLAANKTLTQYQAGDGVWAASDANTVAGVTPTFSNTTGRYPRYNQTSAHPGGCTATLVEPTELLGVKVLQALESTGRWPA